MDEFTTVQGVAEPEGQHDHCHVIVSGNEKGGSGKSTIAIHIAVGLMKLGFRVATLDLDVRQKTLTRHIEYRHRWMGAQAEDVETPRHHCRVLDVDDPGQPDLKIDGVTADVDFLVIDTPGAFTPLSVHAHRLADTLVTPINDSFIDFDVLAQVDGDTYEIEQLSQYALEVREARRFRQTNNGAILDWIVVRNRMAQISSRNEQRVERCLRDLSGKLGFRVADGIGERVIFREFFQNGLTALDDDLSGDQRRNLPMSRIAARMEVRKLIASLHLPIDEAGRKRAAARRQWLGTAKPELKLPSVFV